MLCEDEVEEQDRREDTEVDDDPARGRAVRIVGLTPEERKELSEQSVVATAGSVALSLRISVARDFKPP